MVILRATCFNKKTAFCAQNIFVFLLLIQQTAIKYIIIVSRNGYDGKHCVYCKVRTKSLNMIQMDFLLHSVQAEPEFQLAAETYIR